MSKSKIVQSAIQEQPKNFKVGDLVVCGGHLVVLVTKFHGEDKGFMGVVLFSEHKHRVIGCYSEWNTQAFSLFDKAITIQN